MSTLDIAFERTVSSQTDVLIQEKKLKLTDSENIYIYMCMCVCLCVCVCLCFYVCSVRSIVWEYKSIYIYIYIYIYTFICLFICVCIFEIFALSKQLPRKPSHRKEVSFDLIELQNNFINLIFILCNTVKREQLEKQDRFIVVLEICVFTYLQSWEYKLAI